MQRASHKCVLQVHLCLRVLTWLTMPALLPCEAR